MDVQIGSKLALTFDGGIRHVEGVFVGSETPNFFIVRLPKIANGSTIKAGDHLNATFLSSGNMYKAELSVLDVIKKYDLVFLSYPKACNTSALRKEARISCNIPATANIDKSALKGLITDISNHGCQFIFKIPATFKPYRVSVLTDIHISLSAIGHADPTNLKGRVRNTSIDEFKIVLGIEFEKLEEQIAQNLKGFIQNLAILK
jgi:hypothetical protein